MAQVFVSKKTRQVFPVWRGSKDTIMHLAVRQEFDEEKSLAIEYLAYGAHGKRGVVQKKNQLILSKPTHSRRGRSWSLQNKTLEG